MRMLKVSVEIQPCIKADLMATNRKRFLNLQTIKKVIGKIITM